MELKIKKNKIVFEKLEEVEMEKDDVIILHNNLLTTRLQLLQQLNCLDEDIDKIKKFTIKNNIDLNKKVETKKVTI